MIRYIIQRLIQMVPLIIIISLIAFGIIRMAEVYANADPLAALRFSPTTTDETLRREKLRIGVESVYKEKLSISNKKYEPKYMGIFERKIDVKASELKFSDGTKLSQIKYNEKGEPSIDLKSGEFINTATAFYFSESDIGKSIGLQYNAQTPFLKRFWIWASNFIQGDMGESYYYKTSVNTLIYERVSNTLVLGLTTMIFTWLIAIPLGVFLAVRQYSLVDQVFSSLSYFFMGFPDFFLAILFLLFAATTGLFPISGMTGIENNHLAKIEEINKGIYTPDKRIKISDSLIEYDKKVKEQALKQQTLNLISKDLQIDLDFIEEGKVAGSIDSAIRKLEGIDKFPAELLAKTKSEFKESGDAYISESTAKEVYKKVNSITYFSMSDKLSYKMKHMSQLIYHYSQHIPDVLHHLILPSLTLALISIAALQRRMRGNLLDVLNEDYIKTARAKGLSENKVIYKHAVRNALNPIVTLLGFEFASLLSGAAFIEILFTWPGLGNMMLEALLGSDLNLVMAGLVISSIMLLIGNLLSDLLLAFTDPRIKLEA